MRRGVELPDVHNIGLIFEYCSFVVVNVQIIGCAENRHNRREPCGPSLPVHAIPNQMHGSLEIGDL